MVADKIPSPVKSYLTLQNVVCSAYLDYHVFRAFLLCWVTERSKVTLEEGRIFETSFLVYIEDWEILFQELRLGFYSRERVYGTKKPL